MARTGVVALAAAVVASAIGVGLAHPAAAAGGQVLISDTFANPTTASPVVALSTAPGYPCLTAGSNTSATPIPGCGGTTDPAGSGVLRFTSDTTGHQRSGIVYADDVPLAQGLKVQFKVYQWRDALQTPADGVMFGLAVAPPGPSQLGGLGGFLGYGTDGLAIDGNGLPAGYLGVGFDTYGNFAAKALDAPGCSDPLPGPRAPGMVPNSTSVRGPGNGTTGYCLLSTSGENTTFFHAASRSARGVQILIDPALGTYTVGVDPSGGIAYTTVTSGNLPASYYDQGGTLHAGMPDRVTFVVAGATGAFTDNNEIGDLTAVTLNGPVPVLTLTATDDHGGSTFPGGTFSYVLQPRVDAGGVAETDPQSLSLTATLPANTTLAATPTGTNWDCSASAGSAVTCDYTDATTVPAGTDLPPVTVPVQVSSGASVGDNLDLVAQVTSADAAQPVQANRAVAVGIESAPPGSVPAEPTGTGQQQNPESIGNHHNAEGASNAAATTATTTLPAVTTPCSGACTLAAQTTDTVLEVTATDTAYHGTAVARTPTFGLTVNGGSRPRCPGYSTADHDWVQFGFRADAGPTFEKNARMTTRQALSRAGAERLLATRQVCFAAPYRFPTRSGFALGHGHGEFAGVLPDCGHVTGPCVRSRKLVRVGSGWGVRIVFVVPPNKRDPKALG